MKKGEHVALEQEFQISPFPLDVIRNHCRAHPVLSALAACIGVGAVVVAVSIAFVRKQIVGDTNV